MISKFSAKLSIQMGIPYFLASSLLTSLGKSQRNMMTVPYQRLVALG